MKRNKFIEIIGFIPISIASKINRESGFIAINEVGIEHIEERHSAELKKLGITPLDFARFVADHFNEIRKGTKNELFIIVRGEKTPQSAVIRLKETADGKYYFVETATPMRCSYLNKKELLWIRHTP